MRRAGSVLRLSALVSVFVEVFEQRATCVIETRSNLFVHFRLKFPEGFVNSFRTAALLVNVEDASFEIDAGFDGAKDVVGCTEDTVKKLEFGGKQLEDSLIGGISLIQKVDDDDIVLLTVAMASADSLFDSLGVPGEIIVHDQRAELEVYAFGSGFGGDKDRRMVAKVLDEGGANVDSTRPGCPPGFPVGFDPFFIDCRGFRTAVIAVEQYDLTLITASFEEGLQMFLRTARLRKDNGLLGGPERRHFFEAHFEGGQQRASFGVDTDAVCPLGEAID